MKSKLVQLSISLLFSLLLAAYIVWEPLSFEVQKDSLLEWADDDFPVFSQREIAAQEKLKLKSVKDFEVPLLSSSPVIPNYDYSLAPNRHHQP